MVIFLLLILFIDIIKTIRDPEEPGTLEELQMVNEDLLTVKSKCSIPSNTLIGNKISGDPPTIQIIWTPTNPDCKCALTIALCLRTKLIQQLSVKNAKIDIFGKVYSMLYIYQSKKASIRSKTRQTNKLTIRKEYQQRWRTTQSPV